MDRKALIDALRLGEAACLTMIVFEPLSSLTSKWENAAKIIEMQRKELEAAETI